MAISRKIQWLALMLLVALVYLAGFYTHLWLTSPSTAAAEANSASTAGSPDLTIFWEVWGRLDRDFLGEKPDSVQRTRGAIQGLVGSFGDPYTRYEEPIQSEISGNNLHGSFGGIGASIETTTTGFILHPLREQPAAKAGVLDGDQLIMVDGTVISTTMSGDEVAALVRGPIDTKVQLKIQRKRPGRRGPEEMTFTITRAEIYHPSMEWRMLDERPETANIGYIRHSSFTDRSPHEMHTALKELSMAGADRFIWDMRGNPGGPVDAAIQLVDMWLDEGLILQEVRADGSKTSYTATQGLVVGDAPLVLVVDGGSASASEIVAGALQDTKRAPLVGEKTFGKGSVQLRYELSDGSSLFVTNAHWFTPHHHQISGVGLTPDVTVEHGGDPLPAAIETIQGRK